MPRGRWDATLQAHVDEASGAVWSPEASAWVAGSGYVWKGGKAIAPGDPAHPGDDLIRKAVGIASKLPKKADLGMAADAPMPGSAGMSPPSPSPSLRSVGPSAPPMMGGGMLPDPMLPDPMSFASIAPMLGEQNSGPPPQVAKALEMAAQMPPPPPGGM